jgi:TPR repeat protein
VVVLIAEASSHNVRNTDLAAQESLVESLAEVDATIPSAKQGSSSRVWYAGSKSVQTPKQSSYKVPHVEQFSSEETDLDHRLQLEHHFQVLVQKHIDNNHAICKDPDLVAKKVAPVKIPGASNSTKMTKVVDTVHQAAKQGNCQAQFKLGFAFEKGIGVQKDQRRAMHWYKEAAAQNFSTALVNLGVMYLRGIGVKKNENTAVEYFQRAADAGSIHGMHVLGAMYAYRMKNPQKAMALFFKGADLGDVQAEFSLGKAFSDGVTGTRDYGKALHWYTRAAKRGHADSQANLGVLYMMGKGVTRNRKMASELFLMAAKQGNDYAQLNIGVAYLYGRGVTKNASNAAKWILLSAKQGNKQAQTDMSLLYKNGLGVPKDVARASYWHSQAAVKIEPDRKLEGSLKRMLA